MEKLQISMEYKFQKGDSIFYIVLGEWLRVKLRDKICEGRLIAIDEENQYFILKILGKKVIIKCGEVLDIMPITSGAKEMDKINYMYNLAGSINEELVKENNEELKVKPGDRVLMVEKRGGRNISIETVERITPTGRIVVKNDYRSLNFNKYGEETGPTLPDFKSYLRKLSEEQENGIIPLCLHFFDEKKDELTFEQAFRILEILNVLNPYDNY